MYRSRNYKAAQDGVWSGGGTTDEPKESCPHCLNRGGTLGQCGISGNRNYDLPLNVYGDLLPAAPQATYAAGQTVTVDVVLTAHHKGHFEFAVCPLQHGEIPTATCFDRVEVVEDLLYGAPQDSNYPFRAYIPPASYSGLINHNDNGGGPSGSLYRYKVKLPDGLTGDLVLFQWKYLTANSCEYPGYSSYNWPSDWPVYNKLPLCGPLVSAALMNGTCVLAVYLHPVCTVSVARGFGCHGVWSDLLHTHRIANTHWFLSLMFLSVSLFSLTHKHTRTLLLLPAVVAS